jgi:hypothetical protein
MGSKSIAYLDESCVDRHNAGIKEITGKFQESDRFVIPEKFASRYLSTMKRFFAGKIADLGFSLDELGRRDSGLELKGPQSLPSHLRATLHDIVPLANSGIQRRHLAFSRMVIPFRTSSSLLQSLPNKSGLADGAKTKISSSSISSNAILRKH